MARIDFIGEQNLKDNSILNENVDMKVITPIIRLVQDKYILEYLGTAQYNEVRDAIQADPTLAANSRIKTLVDDYIQPAMVHWLLYELQLPLNYKLTNKNIAKNNSENSVPAEKNEVLSLMDRHKDNAQFYAKKLINYLTAYPTLFPLYTNPGSTSDTVIPKKKPYNKGMYMGKKRSNFLNTIDHANNLPGCDR